MDLDVDTLLREPELLARVFLFLDQKDLRVVEQVCHTWRELVEQQSIWRRRLMQATNTRAGWARAVSKMGLAVPSMDHNEAKNTFLLLCRRLLPLGLTETSWTKTGTEQWIYERARQEDLRVIFQNCPGAITLFNTEREFTMSTLLVFGHSAFPLISTADGRVVMAGAHFGNGRVLVLPHESLLQDRQLLSGAAQWVSSSPTPIVSADPMSRAGPLWQYIDPWHRHLKKPFDDMNSVGRRYLLGSQERYPGPQVYITEGHYDDHGEDVVEYVRRGGGLIIAGHAWFWTSQGRRDQCIFKIHPGNKIISHFGIALTRYAVEGNVSKVPIPTLTTPSRFHLHQAVKLEQRATADDVLHQELIWCADQLRTEEQFKDIIVACDQSQSA